MTQGYILPTPVEVIREIAGCLGIRNTKDTKYLDDKALEAILHPSQLEAIIESVILESLSKSGAPSFAKFLNQVINSAISAYCQRMVGCGFFIGSNRKRALITLNRYFFPIQFEAVLTKCLAPLAPYSAPSVMDLLNSNSAFDKAWMWCDRSVRGWEGFEAASKEEKDKIRNWRIGKHLPNVQSLKAFIPEETRHITLPLLIVARFVDALRKKSWGKRLIAGAVNAIKAKEIDLQRQINKHVGRYFSEFTIFRNHLSLLEKTLILRNKTLVHFEQASSQLLACKKLAPELIPSGGNGLINWFEAKYLVMSGQLDKAKDLYEQAFENLLCCGGNYIESVVNEALVVTSKMNSPDKVFLRKLKTTQVLYGYDIQSSTVEPGHRQLRFEDAVERWEIDMWRKGFDKIFQPHTLFSDVSYLGASNYGPLILSDNPDYKPDLRYPDRKIKVGWPWQRSMPQINYCIMTKNYSAVKKLIEHGANINVKSEVGDSPLLLALGDLNLLEIPYVSLDRRFYDLIVEQPLDPDIINTRTLKKRLLPLIQAVRSGKLEIVHKILDSGANVHQRGLTDNQTALNQIIKMIGMFKEPQSYKRVMKDHPTTSELLDATRRHFVGDYGYTLSDAQAKLCSLGNHPLYEPVLDEALSLLSSRLLENASLEELRTIARLLISKGSDVNAVHSSPVKGYTPLMLAAELDEGELFELMLNHDGDPSKAYLDPNTQETYNSWQIASYWGAHSVLALKH